MAKTLSFSLTTSFQDIVVQTVCTTIIVKEDESVANWPTVNLKYKRNASDAAFEQLTAGKPKAISAPPGKYFKPGDTPGQIAVDSGSSTGIQDEE